MRSFKPCLVAFALLVGVSGVAEAQLIDTAPAPLVTPLGGCNGGYSVHFQTSSLVFVTRLEADLDSTTATQVKFIIWDTTAGAIVYTSPTQAMTPGRKFYGQDLQFQFNPGGDYHIAALANGCASWYVDLAAENQNGIQTLVTGGFQQTFAAPPAAPAGGLNEARIKIYGFILNDFDADGVLNPNDNCPFKPNPNQADKDSDGLGDVCDPKDDRDDDGDGVNNTDDNCPFDANQTQTDSDGDGIGDACDGLDNDDQDGDGKDNSSDNCPFVDNPDQKDTDGDGVGDACDQTPNGGGGLSPDIDGDGKDNGMDNCPFVSNPDQADSDGDGEGDACDQTPNGGDPDGDGVPESMDNCPFAENADQADSDHDGVGDACDFSIIVDGSGCSTTNNGSPLALLALALLVIRRRRSS